MKPSPSKTPPSAAVVIRSMLRASPISYPTPWHAALALFCGTQSGLRPQWKSGGLQMMSMDWFLQEGQQMKADPEREKMDLPEDILRREAMSVAARHLCRNFVEQHMEILVPDEGRIQMDRYLFGTPGGMPVIPAFDMEKDCLFHRPADIRPDWALLLKVFSEELLVMMNTVHGCHPGWPKTEKDAERDWPAGAKAAQRIICENLKNGESAEFSVARKELAKRLIDEVKAEERRNKPAGRNR